MLTPVRSCTSPGPWAAPASTGPAAARAKNACSSIVPAYRDETVTGRGPAAGSGTSVPAAASGSATSGPVTWGSVTWGSVTWGSVTWGSAAAGGSGASGSASCRCARPRRRSTVDWFTLSRRAISASRIPSARQARASSHDASAVSRGRPAGRISPAVPSRSDRCRSVAT